MTEKAEIYWVIKKFKLPLDGCRTGTRLCQLANPGLTVDCNKCQAEVICNLVSKGKYVKLGKYIDEFQDEFPEYLL